MAQTVERWTFAREARVQSGLIVCLVVLSRLLMHFVQALWLTQPVNYEGLAGLVPFRNVTACELWNSNPVSSVLAFLCRVGSGPMKEINTSPTL